MEMNTRAGICARWQWWIIGVFGRGISTYVFCVRVHKLLFYYVLAVKIKIIIYVHADTRPLISPGIIIDEIEYFQRNTTAAVRNRVRRNIWRKLQIYSTVRNNILLHKIGRRKYFSSDIGGLFGGRPMRNGRYCLGNGSTAARDVFFFFFLIFL